MKKREKKKTCGQIVFPEHENNVIEDPDTIMWIEVINHCIYIMFKDGSNMVQAVSLSFMVGKLDPEWFHRCHHSFLINGKHLKTLRRNKRGLWAIMKSSKDKPEEKNKEIPVSVKKKTNFLIL
jgi:DNA-binding LytR/AlgR family response regulator